MTGDQDTIAPTHRRGTGWAPAIVIIGAILALVITPIVLLVVAPTRADGVVGLADRVTLRAEVDGTARIGGFVAPAGWQRSGEDDASESFVHGGAIDASTVTVSLHLDVTDADALLRAGIPVAAALAPIRAIDTGSGLPTSMLEFDQEAGDRVTQRFLACSLFDAQHCLLVEAVVSGEADADAVRELVASAEVL